MRFRYTYTSYFFQDAAYSRAGPKNERILTSDPSLTLHPSCLPVSAGYVIIFIFKSQICRFTLQLLRLLEE